MQHDPCRFPSGKAPFITQDGFNLPLEDSADAIARFPVPHEVEGREAELESLPGQGKPLLTPQDLESSRTKDGPCRIEVSMPQPTGKRWVSPTGADLPCRVARLPRKNERRNG